MYSTDVCLRKLKSYNPYKWLAWLICLLTGHVASTQHFFVGRGHQQIILEETLSSSHTLYNPDKIPSIGTVRKTI